MSLSAALNAARSTLATNATQTSVISRNLAGVHEPMFTRKSALIASFQGGVRVESIGRADNPRLLHAMLGATSQAALAFWYETTTRHAPLPLARYGASTCCRRFASLLPFMAMRRRAA